MIRFKAIETALKHKPVWNRDPNVLRSSQFGELVFGKKAMKQYMTKAAYQAVLDAIEKGEKIDRKVADQVATAMKDWAISKDATHYTHWFQPLTGGTAEKHDAFFEPLEDGWAIEKFSGDQLVQQEPDASSFPNGGIRNTFEARGYTAWDPSSPAFVVGSTLCIPTIFVSYTGEALDHKTPLLKALSALNKAAVPVAKYFDRNVKKVIATLGWEQEYFLIDKVLADVRPDIAMTGRTMIGFRPAKGQQLDDHYFGSIPLRAKAYIEELEGECIKLGIPIKTRHNEVAPNQFEAAPLYEEANLAVDHNSLLMDIMKKVASKHNFRVLFHEKPFANINGSGKHNNWSLATDTGTNLLSPGKTPMENLEFLTFFINTLKAVHDNADILRASIAGAGNDHRLGANEAPPAIISVFIGMQLTKVLDQLEKVSKGKLSPKEKTELKLNVVGKIPDVLLDNTDRNRTSPFAFTGNKFEFRAVGSTTNCAGPMTILNMIMADQLVTFRKDVEELKSKGMSKDDAIFNILREYIKASKKIRFEGDGYTGNWEKEAEKRGLSNFKTTPEALKVMVDDDVMALFEKTRVMNRREVEARYEIQLEEYKMKIQIEGRVIGDLAVNYVLPSAVKYQNILLENIRGLQDVFGNEYKKLASEQLLMVKKISRHIEAVNQGVVAMTNARKKANLMDVEASAKAYCEEVKPLFDTIRYNCDKLEMVIDDSMWPLVKYQELLFTN